jgi:hypothetical protein
MLLLLTPGCLLITEEDAVVVYDHDGDGVKWVVDCDDEDRQVLGPPTWYPDTDGDGLGDPGGETRESCDEPRGGGYVSNADDCNDRDAEVGVRTWYLDADEDGYGNADGYYDACERPDGYVYDKTDCDDGDAEVNPGHAENCGDNTDNDCDGAVDEDQAIDVILWYIDGDEDGYGEEGSVAVRACEAPDESYVDQADDCDDDDPDVHPGAGETCGNGVDDDCDSSNNAACGPGEGDWSLGAAGTVIYGDTDEENLGWAVVSSGAIFDGDEEPDLLISAPGYGNDAGAVFAVQGPLTGAATLGDGTLEVLRFQGAAAGDYFGWSIDRAFDLTHDERTDLIVGAPGLDQDRGAAYILPGPHSPGEGSLGDSLVILGVSEGDQLGYSTARSGDVDRVTVPSEASGDLLLGAPFAGTNNKGAAYLLHGPITISLLQADEGHTFSGEAAGDSAGHAVSTAGDVDGDGVQDVLISAPYSDRGGVDSGAIYLVMGPITGDMDLSDADLKLVGDEAGDRAGYTVAPGGQVYRLRQYSVLIGAISAADEKGEVVGRSYALSHQTLLSALSSESDTLSLAQADTTFVGVIPGEEAGFIQNAGDLNDDGNDDLVVGAPGDGRGRAYLWYGGYSLQGVFSVEDADVTFRGERSNDAAGFALAGGEDVDSDGYEDLLLGSWRSDGLEDDTPDAGAAYLFNGGPGF